MIGAIFARALAAMLMLAANKPADHKPTADDASVTDKLKASQTPWHFDCPGNMVLSKKNHHSMCRGKVVITHDDLTIRCDRIETEHDEKMATKKVTCSENVIITSNDGKATCDKAEFFNDDQVVVLSGNPVLNQDGNIIKGEVIRYNVADETFSVSKIKATIERTDKSERTEKPKQAASQPARK